MTSQSRTRTFTGWTDRENEADRQFRTEIPRIATGRNVQLMKLRLGQMERRLEAARICVRVPRVGLYARTVNGQTPDRSLAAARQFAERMRWQLVREGTFTDCLNVTAAKDRYGWQQIKQHVKSGFADGVVALTRATISPLLDEYETGLSWFATHSGFIALVHAENVVPQ
ncbi:hypothetical protein [Streptomyces sp. 891-h]|uniref:hypothetical protein n=1 Tax=Streptomyces sp. 891-h TaxID=2720714 RepID=UPI001FAA706C|nr:hypothetical protein [Streptomyces sp. 891-h]UNZ18187.1 hypothetical protein HC362_15180 [Streptomyces sp. 891-h]